MATARLAALRPGSCFKRWPSFINARVLSLSTETKDAAEGKGRKVQFGLDPSEVKDYKRRMRELRMQWRIEESARRQSTAEEEEAERAKANAKKMLRLEAARRKAAENKQRQSKLQAEAEIAQQTRIADATAKLRVRQRERFARQMRLVATLEEESQAWLTSDEKIDEKINDTLWEQPGSTGLVTEHSHMFWRYAAEYVVTLTGTAPDASLQRRVNRFYYSPPDLSIVAPTPATRERQRVATMTERLIRTHSPTLLEYNEALEHASEIADAIRDLPVEYMRPRGSYTPRTQQTESGSTFTPRTQQTESGGTFTPRTQQTESGGTFTPRTQQTESGGTFTPRTQQTESGATSSDSPVSAPNTSSSK